MDSNTGGQSSSDLQKQAAAHTIVLRSRQKLYVMPRALCRRQVAALQFISQVKLQKHFLQENYFHKVNQMDFYMRQADNTVLQEDTQTKAFM